MSRVVGLVDWWCCAEDFEVEVFFLVDDFLVDFFVLFFFACVPDLAAGFVPVVPVAAVFPAVPVVPVVADVPMFDDTRDECFGRWRTPLFVAASTGGASVSA